MQGLVRVEISPTAQYPAVVAASVSYDDGCVTGDRIGTLRVASPYLFLSLVVVRSEKGRVPPLHEMDRSGTCHVQLHVHQHFRFLGLPASRRAAYPPARERSGVFGESHASGRLALQIEGLLLLHSDVRLRRSPVAFSFVFSCCRALYFLPQRLSVAEFLCFNNTQLARQRHSLAAGHCSCADHAQDRFVVNRWDCQVLVRLVAVKRRKRRRNSFVCARSTGREATVAAAGPPLLDDGTSALPLLRE